MDIKRRLQNIETELSDTNCKLIAVSKTKPVELLMEAYQSGCKRFGENKVQEMTEKWEVMPKDIEWHMIGHLQTNKVKYIAPFVDLIHSVDSLKLLTEINKQAAKNNRTINCLLQIYIAQEDTKFGLDEAEIKDLLESAEIKDLKNIKIKGLMGMASFTENETQIRNEFRSLKQLFDKLKQAYNLPNTDWQEISMGMSGDYKIAIEEGSTLIRVGSSIFGGR